uniref:cytokinin dehydrogenase n=2 Tax=Cajanus cajan TaxID=3821 RepID=A0A151RUD6_CAJCA|nr:Cytokinin dehydrogenase 3 [Cajanus cajan]
MTPAESRRRALEAPQELAQKFSRNPETLSLASTDYGHIVYKTPWAVFEPSSIVDIATLISFSNSLPIPFTIATRGRGHSVLGQTMTRDGVVLNMTHLNDHFTDINNASVSAFSITCLPLGFCYADAGGEQLWTDLLSVTLKLGLTPHALTNYLYLTIGGTISNAGISGRTFRVGPQISNVLELDVITGKGEFVTCSPLINSELFYAVLGGLGQFGLFWLHLLYTNFTTFSRDQEYLISLNDTIAPDFVDGQVLLSNQDQPDLSSYSTSDQPRVTSLIKQYGIVYVLELVKYYDNNSQSRVEQEVENLVKGLNFLPKFRFKKNASYEEFIDRVHAAELYALRPRGLWDVPHPWLNMFVPSSRIVDFNEGVFKGIILKQNISPGTCLVYPMKRNKWDGRMSAVIPDEDVFYSVNLFHYVSASYNVKDYEAQNQKILEFCKDAGIKIKEYLAGNKTHQQWVEHFGSKWKLFEERKLEFDPKRILSPGQGIFQ